MDRHRVDQMRATPPQQAGRTASPPPGAAASPANSLPLGSFGGGSPLQAGTPQQQAQRQLQGASAASLRSATVPQLMPQGGASPMLGNPIGSRSSAALGSGQQLALPQGTPPGTRSPQMQMRRV